MEEEQIAVEQAEQPKKRKLNGCAISALIVSGIIIIFFSVVFTLVREMARQTTCLSNQKHISLAFAMYVQEENDNIMPKATSDWGSVINYDMSYYCPSASKRVRKTSYTYGYNSNLSGVKLENIKSPDFDKIILTADSDRTDNLFFSADDIAYRHLYHFNSPKRTIVSFLDGHVQSDVRKSDMPDIRVEIKGKDSVEENIEEYIVPIGCG